MKTIFSPAMLTVCAGLFGMNAFGQEGQPPMQKREEIIIQQNDPGPRTIIEIDSNHITVNGKPLADYDGNVIIRKRNFTGGGDHFFEMPEGTFRMFGRSDKAFLGVLSARTSQGAVIKNVVGGSSAQKAGLQEGDVITRVGDKTITSPEDLRSAIESDRPGDTADITYLRKGMKKTQKIVLGKTQGQTLFPADSLLGKLPGEMRPFGNFNFRVPQAPRSFGFNRPGNPPRLGMKIEDTEDGNGVKVLDVEPGSAAEKAGLKKDDIITGVNGEKIKDVYDLRSRIEDSADRNDYKITAKRHNQETDFEVHIPKVLKSIHI